MQEASPASAPSAQLVGNAFVEQYYHILHESPQLVHRFYQDSSSLSRTDVNGNMATVTTLQAISQKIQSLNYGDYTAEIKTADSQESYEKGVIVLVTGCLTGKDNVGRKFAQTFFLAPQEKGYYVLNDVFRYIEDNESLQTNTVLVNGINESAPEAILTAEPEPTHAPDHLVVDRATSFEEEDLNNGPEVCDPSDNDVAVNVKEGNLSQISDRAAERSLVSCSKKKLLILDINGLLADIVPQECHIPKQYKPDITISGKAVFKRPFCDDFLQFCFDRFNVGVWSSRTKKNVDMVIDFLLGDSRHKLLFCWNQSHCTTTRFNTIDNTDKPLVLKELRKLWVKHDPNLPWVKGEYNESNTLLLDDSPYKALRNPANTAIFPYSYECRDRRDASLGPGGKIRSFLEGLAMADNVQKYVEQHPFGQRPITKSSLSWGFYRRVIEDEVESPKD